MRAGQEKGLAFILEQPAMLRVADIISTDFAAHEYGGSSAEYAAEVARADRYVADLAARLDLSKSTLVVTAVGTREPIDPVRVITNRSSGKQAHALADEAADRGAKVTLVTTVDRPVRPGVEVMRVDTAAEMQAAILPLAPSQDVIIMAAAVADFTPVHVADEKLKKRDGIPVVGLGLYSFFRWKKTEKGRQAWDAFKLTELPF